MALAPITAPRLFLRIADAIASAIDAGEYAPGDRLPAERELSRRLAVSRSSLREALSALELQGRVEIRVGSGIYVREQGRRPPPGPAAGGQGARSPFDVLRARRIVESEAAALAARHATPAQVHAIEKAFDRLATDMRANRPHSEGDRLFHGRIAEASGNAVLAEIVTGLWRAQDEPLATRIETLFVTGSRRHDNIEEHRRILEAIGAGDAGAARRAMREHLRNAERQRLALLREPRRTTDAGR
jgi:GntR family transcriptional regulator, transcriptional repressor for pyruvate dehydrogenase complex